jgi:hypothetical protein
MTVMLKAILIFIMMPGMAHSQSFAVFTGREGKTSHIYRLELDSLKITQLTTSTANEMEAAISPDGRQIVFVSDREKTHALYRTSAITPGSEWIRLTAGKGHYERPSFAPDGARVAARFTTDSRIPTSNTRIVMITISDGSETVLLDAAKKDPPAPDDSRITVVDHPAWIGPETVAFTMVSYLQPYSAPRMDSASIWRIDVRTRKSSHLVGTRFSGYNAKGRSHGFSATMPRLDGNRLSFVAIFNPLNRAPMVARLDGMGYRTIKLPQQDSFIGPCLSVGAGWLYGFADDEDIGHLALTGKNGKTRRIVPFSGDAREPAVAPAKTPALR